MKPFAFSILLFCWPAFLFAQPENAHTAIQFGQSFIPDYTFKTSGLKGSHVVGEAEWKTENGELVGKAKPGTGGGWLFYSGSR